MAHHFGLRAPLPPMPIPRFVRPFTKRVINPVTRLFAARMPGFAIVSYVGRRSGRVYRTPLNVFRRGDEYTFALTYGRDVQWVANVLAAGGCEIDSGGRVTHLVEPRLIHDPKRSRMPQPVRSFLGLIGVHEFLVLREERSGARL
jgi:deazaflavin-dependent oxidoreductase (nitroreductase family)